MKNFVNSYVILICLHLIVVNVKCGRLTEIFGWNQIDFEIADGLNEDIVSHHHQHDNHPHHHQHQHRRRYYGDSSSDLTGRNNDALPHNGDQSETFIPYNNVPIGVNHYKDMLFVTVPRRRPGIPSSLNYINLKTVGSNRNPKLRPFPNLETNALMADLTPNENRIISVYRTRIDSCKRLWFIDTGMLEIPNNRTQVQRPSIWIFDLKSNRKLHRFEIPESIVETGNGLVSITVDADVSACNQAFAYIPDLANGNLYVYSMEQNRIWTFHHDFFRFDPAQTALNIGGYNFTLNDGIFSITLGNKQPDGYKPAYFHPLASLNEFVVSTSVLQNENNAARSLHGDDFKLLGKRGLQKQSTMHDFDHTTGIIFYAEIMRNGVGCWNTKKTEFSEQNHGQIVSDSEKMIYPSDLTIDKEGNVWVMTNSMPIFLFSQLNPNEVNFRVWKFSARRAAENTVCAA